VFGLQTAFVHSSSVAHAWPPGLLATQVLVVPSQWKPSAQFTLAHDAPAAARVVHDPSVGGVVLLSTPSQWPVVHSRSTAKA
jgi:hypothetical protein